MAREGNPTIKTLDDLRTYVDSVVAILPLMKQQRVNAVLHTFRTLQSDVSMNSRAVTFANDYHAKRDAADILRWLVYKLFNLCPNGGTYTLTLDSDRAVAAEAIDQFFRYSKIQDAIVSAENGYMAFQADPSGTLLHFRYSDAKLGRAIANRIVVDNSLREQDLEKRLPAVQGDIVIAKRRLAASLKCHASSRAFTYSEASVVGPFMKMISETVEAPSLPLDWSLGPYSLGEFRQLWIFLKALTTIHEASFHLAAEKMNLAPFNSAALILKKDRLLRDLEKYTGLRGTASEEMLRDLTYDPVQVSWVDVMYQPLVPLSRDEWITLPLLLLQSNFERNLLAVVDRLPWRASGANKLKGDREQMMIDEIVNGVRAFPVMTQPRLLVGPKSQPLGDVDLLMWDCKAGYALAVSLKWFYGPDSLREVANHDTWYKRAIDKQRRLVVELRNSADAISSRFSLKPPLTSSTRIEGVVVTKQAKPTALVEFGEIPLVTLSEFLMSIEKTKGNLGSLYEETLKQSLPADAQVPIRESSEDIRFGDYTVTLPALEYQVS